MIIKKFQGKTEADATEQAKKELGPNVVIMNVKNVKRKGIFAFLKPQMVEVTAALEEESERSAYVKKEEKVPLEESIPVPVNKAQPIFSEETLRRFEMNSAPKSQEADKNENVETKAIEEKLDNLQSLLEQKLQPKEAESVIADTVTEEKNSELIKFEKLLYNKMIENEVNETYANQIIEEMEKNVKPNMPFDQALANIYQKMILKFGKPETITPAKNGPKVVFFIGPTGVGKTTTIAKIASKFSVEGKKKVALLTTDTYRIAAAEQLRTYADILEVPFRVIYTVEEIDNSLRDFKDYDYIFVDTAGHSHKNEIQKANMNEFIHSVDGKVEKEAYLVLSATTKYRDLLSIADSYSEMTEYKLIFTKLDETVTLGNLLNLKLYTGAPLSYVTCGQNVPDDIEQFNPQKTVKLLLGGKSK
ncbi:MAG: flagellar biosynthesis protein FlhF [Lachnospiraceae bacterium]|nr:flagellar biosynthesis protein FlhF [Lachnospiraceae bacterium]